MRLSEIAAHYMLMKSHFETVRVYHTVWDVHWTEEFVAHTGVLRAHANVLAIAKK